MTTVILVVHLMLAIALIGVIMLQKSEGRALDGQSADPGDGGAGGLLLPYQHGAGLSRREPAASGRHAAHPAASGAEPARAGEVGRPGAACGTRQARSTGRAQRAAGEIAREAAPRLVTTRDQSWVSRARFA